METALELVPRSEAALREGLREAAPFFQSGLIGSVNIPDLTRLPLRSWEAAGLLADSAAAPGLIPHLRARDFAPGTPFPLAGFFRERRIRRALVISGDPAPGESDSRPPADISRSASVLFIKKLKEEMPELEVFAAFDPYRSNIRYELDYLAAKEEAGASGFMSQPFFDLRLLEIYAEYLEGRQVFWGVSPVLTAPGRLYWESRNRAVFPKQFVPSLEWNAAFGRRVIAFCRKSNFSLYLMPIKVPLSAYLAGLFG
ncbi:MAG: methylenetetrahydrofolate reductase [Treponematales bacterium]